MKEIFKKLKIMDQKKERMHSLFRRKTNHILNWTMDSIITKIATFIEERGMKIERDWIKFCLIYLHTITL